MTSEKNTNPPSKTAFFEDIVEHLPCTVFRCLNNDDLSMLYISKGVFDLTGYTAEELMDATGPTLPSLILPEQYDRVFDEIQAAIKSEKPFEISHCFIAKNGEQKWVAIRGHARYTSEYYVDPEAELSKLVLEGITFDITQQKLAEIKIQQSSNGLRKIMVESIEGVLIHRHSRALFANKSFINILGYDSYDKVLEMDNVTHLFAPYEQGRIAGYILARANGEKVPSCYDVDALHEDGSIRHLEVKSSEIDWNGEPATLSTYIDRTKLKLSQRQAERQRQELSHTNRLNMLGEMTSSIAHEMNQPLTAIVSRCAAAKNRISRENPDLEKIKQALESIEEQALRSGETIKQLRAIVKPKENAYQSIDLNKLLEESIEFIKSEGLFSTSRIKTNFAADLPFVIGDPKQIQQVILNLIRNASDSMQGLANSDRCLKISAIPHDDSAVQISVSDSGEGINEKQEENLFKSFYSTKEDGIGMGLSTSRSIIAAHNGNLWFSHNAEQGVTFRFTLLIDLNRQGEIL